MLPSSKPADLLTLAEAADLIVYGASCNRCHETRRVDLAQLRNRLGPHFFVGDVRPRLLFACSLCARLRGKLETVDKETRIATALDPLFATSQRQLIDGG